ncbi:MAG: hypothetical protein GX941_07725 [Candidatus Methanofastidiosa archaeon]|nr:hypothetical protein [Candidatus Methanofastidiosa archaeon]
MYPGYEVLHIDRNKMNFRKSNLKIMPKSEYAKLYWFNRYKK